VEEVENFSFFRKGYDEKASSFFYVNLASTNLPGNLELVEGAVEKSQRNLFPIQSTFLENSCSFPSELAINVLCSTFYYPTLKQKHCFVT